MSRVDLERLHHDIRELARTPRPAGSPELEKAREYVIREMEHAGWRVTPVPFESTDPYGHTWHGVNLIFHPDGPPDGRPWFCLGAHLDSLPHSPGADDNASAVATALEVARRLPRDELRQGKLALELVIFDLEEQGMLGGEAHVRYVRRRGQKLMGMTSLEMVGYCDHRPNSQSLPRSLVGLYPDTGDFIAIIGNQNSGRLIEAFRQEMRRVDGLPVETLEVPENGVYLQATRLSDHSPFWDAGYPAVMITDTSFLRNPHYHQPTDTIETLDFTFLHRVAQGCLQAIRAIIRDGF